MTFGFIIDPPETLTVDMDTTMLMVSECNNRDIRVLLATPERLFLKNGKLHANWWLSSYTGGADVVATLHEYGEHPVDGSCNMIFMRKDPPVNSIYCGTAQLLQFTNVKVVNDPVALLSHNEKLIPGLSPFGIKDSYVSNELSFLMGVIESQDAEWVAKPINNKGGHGVFKVRKGYPNNRRLLQEIINDGQDMALIQKYLPDVAHGDKRIFMLAGKPIGWMNRIPQKNEFRANIHLGASPVSCDLTKRDKEICEWVGKQLSPRTVPMVAIDVIGEYLSEVNITSPSGIPEINKVMRTNLEAYIIDYFLCHDS